MKKFIRQVAIFGCTGLIILTSLIIALNIWTTNKANFQLEPEVEYVLFGHSHPACAFNDSLIQGVKNLAEYGEPYFYTFPKVEQVLLQNPQIKGVFIEFTNNQVDGKLMNQWIWDSKRMSFRYPKYLAFFDLDAHLLLLHKNFSNFINCLSISIKERAKRLFKGDFYYGDEIGGYTYLDRNKVDSLVEKITVAKNKQLLPRDTLLEISSNYNLQYLLKIVDLCQAQNKQVYFIRSPQHKLYKGLKNEQLYKQIKRDFFSDIDLLDFNDLPLENDKFADLDHLNYKGASVVSQWFNNLLRNNLLEKADKADFISQNLDNLN